MSTYPAGATVAGLRAAFDAGVTKPLSWRRAQLHGMRRMLHECHAELEAALAADLGKPAQEAYVHELAIPDQEIRYTLRRLDRWTRPRAVPVPGYLWPARARVVREPLGVVLVLGPWNFPLQLTLIPLVGALAAGNAVLLKPSELAPATSAALARLLPRHLDPRAVAVVEGDGETGAALLEQRFDHVFYTGGERVGRLVYAAAAKHLTPVTLELGGKSPAWVDETVDVDAAARALVWGRFLNAGQACVAPDHVLAPAAVVDRLVPALDRAVTELYGPDPATSPDYGRIVDGAHLARLRALLEATLAAGATLVRGGEHDEARRYLAPTILRDVRPDHPVMDEEIFGPILPVLTVRGFDEAVAQIGAQPRPLAAYALSTDPVVRRRLLRDVAAGSVGIGVPMVHSGVPGLPFGGVGASGIGAYHGETSLRTFSHEKAVMDKGLRPDTTGLLRPPFSPARLSVLRRVLGGAGPSRRQG